ncbi:MAG: FAD-dependent oxidoreductase [Paenibacillaceae bacterium]
MEIDVVVIGGGPAGLKAAKEIAERGGSVVVLDENKVFGGKLLGQLHEEPSEQKWWNGQKIASQLVLEALSAGVKLMGGVQVWGLEPGWKVQIADTLNRSLPSQTIIAKVVLLATGAAEKPLPVPGWTMPGVMTIGAAQVLTNLYKVKPGRKVIICGLDVLSLSIAKALVLAGVKVEGIVLSEQDDLQMAFSKLFAMSQFASNRIMRCGGNLFQHPLLQSIAVHFFPLKGLTIEGIPLLLKQTLVSIEGKGQVESVQLVSRTVSGKLIPGSEISVPVDAVCLSGGLTPLAELAAIAGCKFVRLAGLSGSVPLHNALLETTVGGLYVAGNITGIEGAKVAMAQGELAGKSICAKQGIGHVGKDELDSAIQTVDTTRSKAEFQFNSKIAEARLELGKIWISEQEENV